ncbi:MAG: DMT family transporter, partial [Deltaproteobacteria bacterium]|nr:DMT family transporter [Deltaproteobacteria bacterium]
RFMIALPFFWLAVYLFPSSKVNGRDAVILALSGLVGFCGAAYADFYGLLYVDASLERVIIYTYPAIVVLWTAVFFNERLDARKLSSIALTYLGLALTLKLFNGGMRADLFGSGLILVSAVIYSLNYIITEVLGRRVAGVKISAYTATAAGAGFIGAWHGSPMPQGATVWALLAVMGVVSTFIPVLTLALAIKRIGAGKSALVSFVGPVSTAVLAYIVLGEKMDSVQITGMALVIAGVLVISSGKGRAKGGI